MLSQQQYHNARISRDARFDGLFFVAVKTTGIYCRPICPAPAAKEQNVEYFTAAWQAGAQGYRPCLRCRPDASPGSPAWQGASSSVQRAMQLIDQGTLEQSSLPELAGRLGIGDRYLRKLFERELGVSPQAYAQLKRCDFAKQLLQNSELPVTEVALASGFGSLRQFNDQFKKYLGQSPSALRKQHKTKTGSEYIELPLAFRPPYNWPLLRNFIERRLLKGVETLGEDFYGRSFSWQRAEGDFIAHYQGEKNRFWLKLRLDSIEQLRPVIKNIRRVLDLDANTQAIESHLKNAIGNKPLAKVLHPGLRLPGIWSAYEAGIRAIIGQQISVVAATGQLAKLIAHYGSSYCGDPADGPVNKLFPSPARLAAETLGELKMPGARKQSLIDFSALYSNQSEQAFKADHWLAIKGVGPWTLNYARLRGLSEPDILLDGDLGIKKAMAQYHSQFKAEDAAPWRSYLNMQLWSLL